MKNELMQEMYEYKDMKIKSKASEILCTLLHNAICYMFENNMTQTEIAEYLGCSCEMIDDIEIEDYEAIAKENM